MKYICSIILLFYCFTPAFAGNGASAADSTETTSVTLAARYSSNADYYGETSTQRLPYVLTNATVTVPGRFSLSGAAYKLLNIGTGVSAGSLTAAYDYNFTSAFAAGVSYSHTFFPKNSPFVNAGNNNTASAAMSYDWWLKTEVDGDYAFGTDKDVFVSLSNSKSLSLGSLFSKNDNISLEPAIEVVAGTQHFYETYTTKKKLKDKVLDGLPGLGKGRSKSTTTTVEASKFDLFSYSLKLPLSYNRANYLIEAGYQLTLLGKRAEAPANKMPSFFNLTVYYLL